MVGSIFPPDADGVDNKLLYCPHPYLLARCRADADGDGGIQMGHFVRNSIGKILWHDDCRRFGDWIALGWCRCVV